jgi:hypothetical protein
VETFVLVVEDGPNRGERLPLPLGGVAVVGRAPDAQVRLPEDDKKVSRYQAILEARAAGVEVQDLNSRNGTFVNGARVQRSRLAAGDLLRLGRTTFRLATSGAAPTVSDEPEPAVTEGDGEESDVTEVAPVVPIVPTAARTSQTCAACGAVIAARAPSPWPEATFLCEACAAHTYAQKRKGNEPLQLGGFEVLRFLSAGGMGAVYEGWHRATAVRAALKVLCPEIPPSHPLARRFLREQRVHAALISERIVRCYVVSNDPDRADVCIAMEFVPGGDARRLAGPASDIRQIVALGADLFEALACGHQRGLVHRDVKPGNLLLTLPEGSGRVRGKLADYGLAKSLQDAGGGTTATGLVAGSPLFAAPEQLLDFKHAGTSADIYGAAATLYNLLTGQPPISLDVSEKEAGVAGICLAVLDVTRVPLRARRPDVPPQLADWLDAMLQRDPAHRARVGSAEVARWLGGWR